jgi:hypothetical protein
MKSNQDSTSCLVEHVKDVTSDCKQELERVVQMRRQALSRGGGALSSFGGLNAIGPPVPLMSYEGRFGLGLNTTAFTENKLNISSPIYRFETSTIALSVAGSVFHMGTPLVLDKGKQVPTDLYRSEIGVQYYDRLPEKKNWGVRGSVGYAGDKPFSSPNDITYGISAQYGFPGSENGFWMMYAFFSNNNTISNFVPIPGFSYLYRTESFTGLFGFPMMSLQWTPVFPWSFSTSIFGPTIQSEVGYGVIDRFQVFSGFYWTRQNYIPSERDDSKDRLTIEEKKMAIGFRIPLWDSMLAELQCGRAFDRSVSIGTSLFNKGGGSVSAPPDWYVSTKVRLKF